MDSKIDYGKARQVLISFTRQLDSMQDKFREENLELKVYPENLEPDGALSHKIPALQVYLIEKEKDTPFFAALSPTIRFHASNRNTLSVSSKTVDNITDIRELDSINLEESDSRIHESLEEHLNSFMEETFS